MKYCCVIFPLALLAALSSCQDKKTDNGSLFETMNNTGIEFNNQVEDGRLENSFLFRNFYNGGGVAIGDINNDGLPDIFLTSNTGANKLYLNKGDFQFEDISEQAGILVDDKWNTGVVFADVNGDGWLDIYVCSSGHMGTGTRQNKLYINNKNLSFSEEAKAFGLDISAYTTQVSFFDYDGDGDLDCFMINNSPIPINQLNYANRRDLPDSLWKIADFLKGGGDHLYRNDDGFFKEVTREAGIHGGLISFGLGVSVGDINEDGWPDVFVSNDSYERDYLYINQQNGTFKDELEEWFQHTSFSSMGADIADINNDGYPDLFTTDMLPMNDYRLKTTGSFDNISLFNSKLNSGFYYQYTKNCLQLNNGNGKFIDIGRYSGVSATDWSWGALMFDMDNDGWNDLLVCNGVNRDVTNLDFMDFFANDVIQKMVMTGKKDDVDKVLKEIPQTPVPNKVYRNDRNLRFTDIGEEWGLGQPTFSNGAAYGDLDNDGDLDLVINNENQPVGIYRNRSREQNQHNYIALSLTGSPKNRFAIGARVKLYAGDMVFTREQVPSRGFQSSVDYKLVIGLGTVTAVDSIVIIWPDRTVSKTISPAINQVHELAQAGKEDGFPVLQSTVRGQPFLYPVDARFEKHREDGFIDFYTERGIPRVLSREGPKTAVADINGDGLDDIFIGGGKGQSGQIYLQQKSGNFVRKEEEAFQPFMDFEDVAALFFDVDRDGDPDLVIGPGGNDRSTSAREMQLRLFLNDGRGNFQLQLGSFPVTESNISVLATQDINGDGIPDLFVGSRNATAQYGADPRSYLFLNDGKGHFSDVTEKMNKDLAHIGMVTGATWADMTGDGKNELVIVGEWMAPRIFEIAGNEMKELETGLGHLYGWWQSVSVADINRDGLADLVLGNIGENFYLAPDEKHPVRLWYNDYDNNNDINKIISYTINGRDMPVFLKHDLEEQLPIIKKDNLRHEQYAEKPIQQLFPKEIIKNSSVKLFTYPSSCVAINLGGNKFRVEKLPLMAQLSCINAVVPTDLNGDGSIDLITGGNQFGFLPQFEKLDGNFGDILINDGKGGFRWQPPAKTGAMIRGEVRDLTLVSGGSDRYLLFTQNNDYPVLYRINKP